MKVLTFAPRCGRVRNARFEERSLLPVAAACVVASGTRERLSALLGTTVIVRLFEPQIPTQPAWQTILRDAMLYRIRGNLSDAIIILRPRDAATLAAAAFGETGAELEKNRVLSPLECEAIDRAVHAIAGTLTIVCGDRERDGVHVERIQTLECAVTYFEMALDRPVRARIGIALYRDPAPAAQSGVRPEQIGDLALEASVVIDLGRLEAAAVARLVPGQILPIPSTDACRGVLRISNRLLARGVCGTIVGRYALEIEGMTV